MKKTPIYDRITVQSYLVYCVIKNQRKIANNKSIFQFIYVSALLNFINANTFRMGIS